MDCPAPALARRRNQLTRNECAQYVPTFLPSLTSVTLLTLCPLTSGSILSKLLQRQRIDFRHVVLQLLLPPPWPAGSASAGLPFDSDLRL